MSDKVFCCEQVIDHTGYRLRGCAKTGRIEHEGKFYCATHYPPNIKEKAAERERLYNAKNDRIRNDIHKINHFDELLEALVKIANGDYDNAHSPKGAAEVARAAIAKAEGRA